MAHAPTDLTQEPIRLIAESQRNQEAKFQTIRYVDIDENKVETKFFLTVMLSGFSHQEHTFIGLDENGRPEKWYFTEYPRAIDPNTVTVFKRVWSETQKAFYVVKDDSHPEDDGYPRYGPDVFYSFDDFERSFTAAKGMMIPFGSSPPLYQRDPNAAYFQFWLELAIRANDASDGFFPIQEDIDRLRDFKVKLKEILNRNVPSVEQYEEIRKLVINYDLASQEALFDFFR